MDTALKSGQRFKFRLLSDPLTPQREAVVVRIRTDLQEGLSPEALEYVAYWVEANEIPSSDPDKLLYFSWATDEHWYLDGESVEITPIS